MNYKIILLFLIVLLIFLCVLLTFRILPIYNISRNNLKFLDKIYDKKYDKKSIAIVTLETRDLTLLYYHNKNIEEYAKKYGYTYIFIKEYENKLKLPIYWQKIQLVLDILQNNTDIEYVIWMDSDTMICHQEIPLEYIIEQDMSKSIYIGLDYPSNTRYNAGVFIIKNDQIGKQFLIDCINSYISNDKCKEIINGVVEYKLNGAWSGECYEQGTMNALLNTTYINHFHSINKAFLMNIALPVIDTFILHMHNGTSNMKETIGCYFKQIYENKNIKNTFFNQFTFLIKKFMSHIKLSY